MQKAKSTTRSGVKKWVGWFRPLGRGTKHGPLIAVLIDIFEGPNKLSPKLTKEAGAQLTSNKKRTGVKQIVVSVPRTCGTAVQRNRFRRIVKARFSKKKFGRETVEKEIGKNQDEESPSSGPTIKNLLEKTAAKKGLWIRLLNRHRLGRKIKLEDWKKEFDTIENLYCR